jgi:hypothetical protein
VTKPIRNMPTLHPEELTEEQKYKAALTVVFNMQKDGLDTTYEVLEMLGLTGSEN